MFVYGHLCHSAHGKGRGKLEGVGSLFSGLHIRRRSDAGEQVMAAVAPSSGIGSGSGGSSSSGSGSI